MSGLRLHPDDDVSIALADLEPGDALEPSLTAAQPIPRGHKAARRAIARGAPIRKYGQVIGFAARDIAPGEHVHTEQCAMGELERDFAIGVDAAPIAPAETIRAFEGFRRPSGKVGTRNFIGLMSSVNCSATVVKLAAQRCSAELLGGFPNVDGIIGLTHGTGCGLADPGEGFETLSRTLWGYARHPNFAGVLMIGLGCEVMQLDFLLECYGLERGPLFRTLVMQEAGGTRKTIEAAMANVEEMLPLADAARREPCPASEIALALQCGGSDAYSGITANPALGVCADLLVAQGGKALLAETPEIYGAEHLLVRRAASPAIAEKLLERIAWWEDYTARNGGEMNNNPSPGNKKGGLSTILEKSLGATAKGGSSPLTGVYRYAEPIGAPGFGFMDSPGYDPVSVTGQVASGCNLIAFTTGRGSCFGFKPAPSLKLATNSEMYGRMSEDMDLDCGAILTGDVSVEEMGAQIFERVLAVASGERTKSERLGLGDHEFTPWQIGAVM